MYLPALSLSPQSQQVTPGASSLSSTPPQWSSSLSTVSISDFTPPVGPTVAISESPSEVFELMFTPSLMGTIVKQTNLYANEVMGDERYAAWDKVTTD